jgi:hypothetical protein
VHRQNKRLPPVAQAFKDFLIQDGAGLIEHILGLEPQQPKPKQATKQIALPKGISG